MDTRVASSFSIQLQDPTGQSLIAGNLLISGNMISQPSPAKKRRLEQKRVVSIPIADADGCWPKGEGPPPSDSWAWRKYGQKPIKGSPYPRGYYRCSSSKGCPARKRVERSRSDPASLIVTYSCEHNHPCPPARSAKAAAPLPKPGPPGQAPNPPPLLAPATDPVDIFADVEGGAGAFPDDFGWFSDLLAASPSVGSVLRSPICGSTAGEAEDDNAGEMIPVMREEDESLFADLGELPGCSIVLPRQFYGMEEEDMGRRSLVPAATCCGSTR